jgi:hypothetical protein
LANGLDERSRDGEHSKFAAVTLSFWIIKILCTTLGETGGDAVTMSMNLGYAVGTSIFAVISRCGDSAGISQAISSISVLVHDHCHHDCRYHDGGPGGPIAGTGLRRREFIASGFTSGFAWGVVLVHGVNIRGDGRLAQNGDILLGHDHVFSDAGHSAGRLGRRRCGSRLPGRRGGLSGHC